MADEWGRLPGHIRRRVRAELAAGLPCPCAICGLQVYPGTAWDVEHRQSVRDHPELVLEASNLAVAHRACNQDKGARVLTVASWSWP